MKQHVICVLILDMSLTYTKKIMAGPHLYMWSNVPIMCIYIVLCVCIKGNINCVKAVKHDISHYNISKAKDFFLFWIECKRV